MEQDPGSLADKINIEEYLGVSVIGFSEPTDLDVSNAPSLRETLHQILDDPDCAAVVLDLGNVSYLDSTSLGVFVGGLKKARQNGSELFIDTRTARDNRTNKILEITGLARAFKMLRPGGTN